MIGPGFFSAAPAAPSANDGAADRTSHAESGRPADGAPFPTVLLALASIGTHVHALTPTPVGAATAGGSDDEHAALVVAADDGSEDPSMAGSGAHGLCGTCLDTAHPGVEPVSLEAVADLEADALFAALPDALLGAPAGHPTFAEGEAPRVETTGLVAEVLPGSVAVRPQEAPIQSQERPDTVTLDRAMLNGLDRAFTPRLQRVAERMWEEHGLRVQVVEGYRSQARQNTLFAQGRSTDGPVVTWTRNSLHTAGVAADVYIDGAPVTLQDAAVLARVASEEGLKTLYPYDSGHIQLASARAEGPDVPGDQSLPQRPGVGTGSSSGIARVAPVARPARPARPGGVVMSEPGAAALESGDAGPTGLAEQERVVQAGSTLASATGGLRPKGAARPGSASPSDPARPVPDSDAGGLTAGGADVESASTDPPAGRTHAAGPLPGDATSSRPAEASSGVPRADALGPPTPVDFAELRDGLAYRRVRLPIDGLAGRASLELGVGPGAVDARLNVSDPQLADRLQASLHELRHVLAERGVEARGLSVRLTAEAGAELHSGRSEPLASSRPTEGESGQTFSDEGRRRSARHEDAAEARDERRGSPRNHDPREDRDDTGHR